MGFESRIQIPEYANLQKFASNSEQLRSSHFFREITKDLMTWKYFIFFNQLVRQDQSDVVISFDGLAPAEKGKLATQKAGIQILSRFFGQKATSREKVTSSCMLLLWMGSDFGSSALPCPFQMEP